MTGLDLGLSGRVVVVFEPGNGVGVAVAAHVAAEGAEAVLVTELEGEAAVVGAVGRIVDERRHVDVVVTQWPSEQPSSLLDAGFADLAVAWAPIAATAAVYHQVVGGMIERRWGRLIHVGPADVKEVEGAPGDLGRLVTLGLLGLHKTLAGELGPDGVTANCVLVDGGVGPDDVAAAVTYLASDAAGFVTGVALTVDGGRGRPLF